jgi:ABC transport system ATP-binding/permease protein
MNSLLSCHNIKKTFSSENLFENFSLNIQPKDHIGLLGPNGAGKSTLGKILAKQEEPDGGVVAYQKNLKVRYVSQQNVYDPKHSVIDVIKKRIGNETIDEHEINRASSSLGFENLEQKVGNLSGGWLKKIEIAAALSGQSDLIIFDEPTNHLDLQSILWLEEQLQKSSFAWICISHDRYFIEKISSKIIEINSIYRDKFIVSNGSYQDFINNKSTYLAEQKNKHTNLKSKLKKERDWAAKSPKARSTKAKYRVDNVQVLEKDYTELQQQMQTKNYEFDFSKTTAQTKKLVEITNLSLQIGNKHLTQQTPLTFTLGQKISLLGLNGSGKSSLLKAIIKQLAIETGTIKLADNIKIVHFDQEKHITNPEQSLQEYLCETGDCVIYQGRQIHIESWRKKFGFSHSQLDSSMKKLSGGEKAKALIAKLILQPADLLLLDEPTNDLDIPTLEVLEESLKTFSGCLVLISHDRFLTNSVCNTFIGIDNNSNLNSYTEQNKWQEDIFLPTKTTKPKNKSSTTKKNKKLSYKEQREYDGMEKQVEALETKIDILKKDLEIASSTNNHQQLVTLSQELESNLTKLDTLYNRWSDLEKNI